MTAAQMSHEFDLLWNNIMSNQAPGLSEYEKSVFLTKAQDEIVKNYLVPQSPGNQLRAGVEDIPKRQADFSALVESPTNASLSVAGVLHPAGHTVTLPTNMLCILAETVGNLAVQPLTSAEFLRLMSKPYKYPCKGQCWRIMSEDGKAEIILPFGETASSYKMTYIRRPHPIIISALPTGYTFEYDGSAYTTVPSDSEAPESLHEDIVQRAVELAKAVWSTGDALVAVGRRTE